MDQNNLLKDLH